MTDKLLSKLQAAQYLGISSLKVDRMRRARELAYIKIGSRVLFRLEDLQDLIDRNRHGNSSDCPGNSPKSAAPEMSIGRPDNE